MKTDSIMTKAWAEVYNGTDRSDEQVLQDFRSSPRSGHVQRGASSQSLTSQLKNFATHSDMSKNNAAGPDAWEDVTLSKLTDTPLRWLATMLNEIENGMKWPRQITKAHATLHPQRRADASHDPVAYRVLLIMSQIYRKWALMRLKHLAPWIHRWALPQMYAGVPGAGSRTSLVATLTWFGVLKKPADPCDRRCYGHLQMLRPNCQATRLHDCESCWHSQKSPCSIRQHHGSNADTKLTGYGAPHTRRRGIPQGCPFSMTFHRPVPRVLADDLHLVAAVEKHYENNLEAIRDTHIFITTSGGRIAASKSYANSTDKRTRKRLANTRYDVL